MKVYDTFLEWWDTFEQEEETGEELAEIAFESGFNARDCSDEKEGKYDFLRELGDEISSLKEDIKLLEENAFFYANENNWKLTPDLNSHLFTSIVDDSGDTQEIFGGNRSRIALTALKTKRNEGVVEDKPSHLTWE